MILNQYRQKADEIGGEVGGIIHELVNELDEARAIIAGKKFPNLLGSKEVAEKIEVDPKNMHHVRKTKLFPEPDITIGSRPFWFETTIDDYQDKVEERRSKKENDQRG